MQTITIECKDNAFADYIYNLLSSLPKSKVKVKLNANEELNSHKKLIKNSFNDLKNGNVIDTGKTVTINAK